MRNFFLFVLTVLWSALVFVFTSWLTFPSEPLAQRIQFEVPNRLGKEMSADVGTVGPYWFGVSAHDVKLYREDREADPPTSLPVALFDRVRVAMSPWSLLRGSPYLRGSLDFVDGSLSYQVGTSRQGGKNGALGLTDLVLSSDGVPIGDLLSLSRKAPASITGNVSVDLEVHAGDNGMKGANGHVAIHGANLVVADIELPNTGPLGFEIPLDKVDIVAEIKDGKAEFSQGLIAGPMVTVELKGSLTLRDPIDRSTLDLEVVLSGLGKDLAPFEGFLTAAKGTDNNYHFYCRGSANRLSASACSPGKPGITSRTPRRETEIGNNDGEDPTVGSETDDERKKRREAIRERIQQKREERAARQGVPVKGASDGELPPDGEELPPVEEGPDENPEDVPTPVPDEEDPAPE